MQIDTVRIRFDRKTGAELARETVASIDVSRDELADRVVRAITGRSPDSVARAIRDELSMASDVTRPGA